jgi:hypothetical protein
MLHGFMEKSRKFQKWKWHSKCYKQIIGNTKVDRVQEKTLKYTRNIYIKSNIRNTTYFIVRSLQTNVTSYVEATTSVIKTQLSINI